MATPEVWILTVIGTLSALIAGHLIITRILPKIKNAMDLAMKDNVVTEGLMIIFFVYIGIFVIRKVLEIVIALNEPWSKYLTSIKPGIEVLTELLPYLGVFMIGVVIAIAIKQKK
ncbi:MAG: hypothetical protein ABIH63_00265 [archaeon]